jgi:predicted RNase H-like HicB family nuclease
MLTPTFAPRSSPPEGMARGGFSRYAGRVELHVSYEPDEGGWVMARIEEIPEVITCAPTQDEAREMIRDALSEWLAALTTVTPGTATAGRETLTLSVA